jgi:hypothetical protein
LIVPSSVADQVEPEGEKIELPPELVPPAVAVAVLRTAPAVSDQVLVHPTEAELGLSRYDDDRLIDLATRLPFEPRCS